MAHELPTEYADFFAFCKMLKEVYNVKRNDNVNVIWDNLKIKLRKDINTSRLRQKFDDCILPEELVITGVRLK